MERKATDHAHSLSSSPGDGELVAKALGGDRPCFDELVRRHHRQATAVSYRLLGNMPDAMEVTQDAFLKAFTSLATLQNADAFAGWLMRIVSNLSLNYRRGRKMQGPLPENDRLGSDAMQGKALSGSEWMARSGDPVRGLQSAEMGQRLQWALDQLPEKQRLAIIMFTIEQMPQKDIAATLQCSVEAIKWHVFQGRKKLKEMLKEHLED